MAARKSGLIGAEAPKHRLTILSKFLYAPCPRPQLRPLPLATSESLRRDRACALPHPHQELAHVLPPCASATANLNAAPEQKAANPRYDGIGGFLGRATARPGANSGGGNEPRFRPAGEVCTEVKNIVYENRGLHRISETPTSINLLYYSSLGSGFRGLDRPTVCAYPRARTWAWPGASSALSSTKSQYSKLALGPLMRHMMVAY